MKWLSTNGGTVGMSLFLAVLTWIYLWSASSATGDFSYQFNPILPRAERLASIDYFIDDHVLVDINVKLTGPRNEIDALRASTPPCSPILDAALFQADKGEFLLDLRREDFKLRDPLRLEGHAPRIRIRYVKLVEKEVPILATADDIEGRVKVGFRVTRVSPQPEKVRVRCAADLDLSNGIPIQKVTVTNYSTTFNVPGVLRLPKGVERLTPFDLTVVVERRIDEPRTISNVPLRLFGPEEIVQRLHLDSPTTIDIEVRGPAEVVKDLVAADFVAYVDVDLTSADIVEPGPRVQNNLFCHLKKKVDAVIEVTVMPGVKAENRQAKVTVLPK